MDTIRITHVNKWDTKGGAARAAHRLHLGLNQMGHESRMLAGYGQEEGDRSIQAIITKWPRWKQLLGLATTKLERVSGLQDKFVWWSRELTLHPWVKSADILHLHNLHSEYISLKAILKLSQVRPVVWSLHDMWPITGHCGFSLECHRWETGCGSCPLLSAPPALRRDTTAMLWRGKQNVYSKADLDLVVASDWLADLIGRSPLLGHFKVHRIPYGLDCSVFKPVPKGAARAELGLPQGAKIALFVAEDINEPRKGLTYALESLQRLATQTNDEICLVIYGDQQTPIDAEKLPFHVQRIASVPNDGALATVFSAADIFIGPSFAESFGLVFLEAMACGTPCVAFKATAVPEVVRHMETGYLAELGQADDLAHGLKLLLGDDELRGRMSLRCRQIAQQEYSQELQAQRHDQLYREVLTRWQATPLGVV